MEKFGAVLLADNRCRFVAWAPEAGELSLVICGNRKEVVPMRTDSGFHVAETAAKAGTRYLFRLPDGRELPDPASRFQPDGVHGPSSVMDTRAFEWTDASFAGHALANFIIYELHVGTFTEEGTFAAAAARLADLAELGVTAVEMMPVAQFSGNRNWGYDGVFPFAAQNSYGGPAGLQQFVDAAHAHGLSVILDVVYNHLGPEGNYAEAFGPFFTDRYHTPWGRAINFDGAESGPVRDFFIQNALYWLEEFHVDALRLDAVHGIFDFGARHILAELAGAVHAHAERTGRRLHVIAESDLNDSRLLHAPSEDGYGLDAQWSDDFHHAVHTLLTGETSGYYADFGLLEDLCTAMREGWRYSGQYSRFRRRHHGTSTAGISTSRFVVFSQNHDQVGNRAAGERLVRLTDRESAKLAAGLTLLSPFVPLLFMGEEYGKMNPFLYFTGHSDLELAKAVREGRCKEFEEFSWTGEVPDPQDEETFRRSILNWAASDTEPHRSLRAFYARLIARRKRHALCGTKPEVRCDGERQTLTLEYSDAAEPVAVVFYFGDQAAEIPVKIGFAPSLGTSSSTGLETQSLATNACARGKERRFRFERRSFAIFEPDAKTHRAGEN